MGTVIGGAMRRLIVNVSVTLDGVMQAPGRADEDRRGGFQHGGWAMPYFDPVMGRAAAQGMATMPDLLFGRRTYQDFYDVWPKRTDNPFTAVLDGSRKYVVSRTLREPLPWINSTLLEGDGTSIVAALKRSHGKDLVVLGSGELVRSLMRAKLIDRYALSIHPLVLGSGRRLFEDGGSFAKLRMIETKTTTTGVVLASYEPAT
jgi:dihydrofolate reductase